ncbi:MAG: hypothetical protein ACWGO1_11290, partial [Anaerolineales bacterium]
MNYTHPRTKIILTAIALTVFTAIVLVATTETRANLWSRLEELVRVKDEMLPEDVLISGSSRIQELAQIKDQMYLAEPRLNRPSKLEELARIRDDIYLAETRFSGAS